MSVPVSMRSFLFKARDTLQRGLRNRTKLTFVIGNESADLDSLTSSLLYSYIRTSYPDTDQDDVTYIPITNIPSSDIQLRPEFKALLPHAGLEPAQLLTLDDLPMGNLQQDLPPANTKWILVDHNAFQGVLGKVYGRQVVGVIDHHEEENQIPRDNNSEPRIIDKAGSCTSLVVQYVQKRWLASQTPSSESGASNDTIQQYDSQAARLALASVLIDTANLQDNNKTTDHDKAAVEFLNTMIREDDHTGFYEELQNAKQDIGSLSLRDILRKDYKQWSHKNLNLGIASVVKPLEFLAAKATDETDPSRNTLASKNDNLKIHLLKGIQTFANSRKLDIMAVMTTSSGSDGEFQRELLIYAANNAARKAAEKFVSIASTELKLQSSAINREEQELQSSQYYHTWKQKAVQHSRKRVAPLLRKAIEETTTESQL